MTKDERLDALRDAHERTRERQRVIQTDRWNSAGFEIVDDPNAPADLVFEPPYPIPESDDTVKWKCADCPGPHHEDHTPHCRICGEPAEALLCVRHNVGGQQSALVPRYLTDEEAKHDRFWAGRAIVPMWDMLWHEVHTANVSEALRESETDRDMRLGSLDSPGGKNVLALPKAGVL